MRIRLLAILAILLLVPIGYASAATGSGICKGTTECSIGEVGTFMQGISVACGNLGTCSITDITQVFYNVGNFILEIVGGLVFLAYVVGGFFFLLSGAPGIDQVKWRQKGMDALKKSTLGLIIVFVAYAGMYTLRSALKYGSVTGSEYVLCGPGNVNAGLACDLNSTCSDSGSCISECEKRNESAVTTAGTITFYECIDTTTATSSNNYGKGTNTHGIGTPEKNLCPGGDNIQCQEFNLVY